jgi:hypothetical protein
MAPTPVNNAKTPPPPEREIGRNEPCPCGSGRKYKRCCGVNAAPKLTEQRTPIAPEQTQLQDQAAQMDPKAMAQMSQLLQRLPKGQMQRLQSLMQKAMSGKDVSREAEAFEQTLPLEFQQLVRSMAPPAPRDEATAPAAAASAPGAAMSEEEARRLVAEAAATGKISPEEAEGLLHSKAPEGAEPSSEEAPKTKGIGRFWRGLRGKGPEGER